MAEQADFYYDLGSPFAYLAAERITTVLGQVPAFRPILLGAIWRHNGGASWAATDRRAAGMAEVERRARDRGLPPIVWPEVWPSNSLTAMRAATYATAGGRGASFALAAFRQAFAAGRDLADIDNVLLAAAACELHPRAVLAAIETRTVKDGLREATEAAVARGVIGVPTVAVGDELFWGDDQLERAAERMAVDR